MSPTILYPEAMYPDDAEERRIHGPDATILFRNTAELSELPDEDCAQTDGLMIFRQFLPASEIARFPRLRAIVRMGVGYDRIDRKAAAARNILVCNVPDYGTTEVADHAIALALTLRRGIALHHDAQRRTPPAAWKPIETPLIRRTAAQRFGILGLGRIGTAAALRAKALGCAVTFYDPYLPNGADRALGIARAATLADLLRQTDTLSIHTPLTAETKNMLGRSELGLLPKGAVVINTARGPILDLDALADLLEAGHLSGAGLDVIPVEPPANPIPRLLNAYRTREAWTEGRVIITPHSAFHSPEAWQDIRTKSAETMHAALAGKPQNVITPDMA
ncbi:MAG TPA: C-terminal binding protein [Acetobacteraceae bacterium]|nr:C-terminal binding protein [Acetobacteraceae bacterium]